MLFEKLVQANDNINEMYLKQRKGYTIALLGNPNVGKSTVFNELTGMNQHTGNWPGKTVELAKGHYTHRYRQNQMIDLPGTYSCLHTPVRRRLHEIMCALSHAMCAWLSVMPLFWNVT